MPQHETLAAALAAFQAELPKLTKDQSAKVQGETQDGRKINYSYGYADLSQVTEEVSPALGKHGLSFTSFPTVIETGAFMLTYSLLHESGEKLSGVWPLPDPVRTKPQQLGSAITYARRYAFMAVTNTFPGGEDDDGAQAVPTGHGHQDRPQNDGYDRRPQHAPTSPAAPRIYSDDEVTEMHGRLNTLDLGKAGTLYDWMAGKGLHTRLVGGDGTVPPVTATTRLAVRLAVVAADETTTTENLSWLRDFADGRGLLKTQVSPKSDLGSWLTEERDRRVNATVDQSDTAQAMRAEAQASWADPDQSEDSAAAQARDAAYMASPGSAGAPGQ